MLLKTLIARGGAALLAAAMFSFPAISGADETTKPALRAAPEWDIVEWLNGDPGDVAANRGKVIVIDFFQLWCPGCNQFSGPLMEAWSKRFAAEIASGDLVLVKIHTVFEGHGYQTTARLRDYVKEKNITLPVGVDRHLEGDHKPVTMRRYRTRGTPEIVMIDRDGKIRFQHFAGFEPAEAEQLLESLLGAPPPRPAPSPLRSAWPPNSAADAGAQPPSPEQFFDQIDPI